MEWGSKKADLRQDSVIGMLWAFGMALGIIFIYLTPGYAPNLMTYLFGSILTVNALDLYLLLGLSVLLIVTFSFFLRPILYAAFDEEYARTHKAPVQFLNYVMISLVAICIVLNIRVVGIILVISFLTIPQMIANMFTHDFKKIILLSILFGVLGSFMGLCFSYFYNIPSGATIIFAFVAIFVCVKVGFLGRSVFLKRKTLENYN